MGLFRLYTGEDGQSHFEDQSLASHPELTNAQTASRILFAEMAPASFLDWHPAPRRQYVIILSGTLEIGLGDGTTRRFGAGDARLVEDTTGQGHTTRAVSKEPVVTAVVPLTK